MDLNFCFLILISDVQYINILSIKEYTWKIYLYTSNTTCKNFKLYGFLATDAMLNNKEDWG